VRDPGFIYSRYSNPTISMFERRMIELEGAEACRSTATGMAAVTTAVLAPLKAGDHVVGLEAAVLSVREVEDSAPRYGISSTLVNGLDLDAWEKAMRPKHQKLFPGEPDQIRRSTCSTFRRLPRSRTRRRARLIVDNVFATPIWQSRCRSAPMSWCIPATKHIDGQGRCLGGVIARLRSLSSPSTCTISWRQTGPSLSPASTPGSCSRDWRRWRFACARRPTPRARSRMRSPTHPKVSRLIYPGRADHPQAALVKKQMRAGSTLVRLSK